MITIIEQVRAITQAAPARSPERRAAAALHTALITTKTPEAALRALRTFTDPATRAAAVALLGQLEQEAAVIECGNCGQGFNPVASRWLCPSCGHKESCCEGEAALWTTGNESGAGAARWWSWSCSRWADTS